MQTSFFKPCGDGDIFSSSMATGAPQGWFGQGAYLPATFHSRRKNVIKLIRGNHTFK
jgi:hypothetical protein